MSSGRRMRQSRLARLGIATALSAALLAFCAASVPAAVTIGQLAPPNPSSDTSADTDRAQPSVTSGNSYVVPEIGGVTAWTLTSWSHNAAADVGQEMTMKVFRKAADPLAYTVVGHDGPRPLTPSIVNTFQTRLSVKTGDVLGNNSKSPVDNASYFPALGDSLIRLQQGISDGQTGTFVIDADLRLNITASLEPTNTFSLGRITRNKKRGTATLEATVPNPGDLSIGGKGVKSAEGGTAVSAKAVSGGPVKVAIRARGKKKRKLNETGKVKLNLAITYTPTGGAPSTDSAKVKLRKR